MTMGLLAIAYMLPFLVVAFAAAFCPWHEGIGGA